MARPMFSVTTDLHKHMRRLKRMSKEALPQAMAATLNQTAHSVQKRSDRNIRKNLTVRTEYTVRSLRTSEAKVRSSGRVGYAVTGSVSPYLPIQDTGGTIRARRKAVAIPTRAARGGNKGRAIMPRFRLNKPNPKFFVLRPANPVRRLKKPGLFIRQGKKRLIHLRDLSMKSVKVRPVKWHSEAVSVYGTRRYMSETFIREAQRKIRRLGVK